MAWNISHFNFSFFFVHYFLYVMLIATAESLWENRSDKRWRFSNIFLFSALSFIQIDGCKPPIPSFALPLMFRVALGSFEFQQEASWRLCQSTQINGVELSSQCAGKHKALNV